MTNFSVASNRQFTNNAGEKIKETTWTNVTVWGPMAEACNEHLRKGKKVLVVGRLKPDATTGGPRLWHGQEGEAHASFEMIASYVQFLSPSSSGGQQPVGAEEFGGDGPAPEDDIPF